MRLKSENPSDWSMILRLGCGLVLLVVGLILLRKGLRGEEANAIGITLVGCGCLVVAGILWAGPLISFLAQPFGNLFFPNDRYSRPQPLYSLAEAQAGRHEFEQAMATYEGIAEGFPEEVRPWIGMIEIAVKDLGDLGRAQGLFERGLQSLTTPEAKDTLATMFRGIRSRAGAKPEWGQARTIDYPGRSRPPGPDAG